MTLFNDEEIDEEKPEPSRLWRWTRRLFYTALVLFLCLWVTLRVLMNLGGNSADLRNALEQLLTGAAGQHATIGQLEYLKFYPEASVDMSKVSFSETKNGIAVATVGAAKITVGFWSLIFSSNKVEQFDIQNIDIKSGLVLRRAVHIDKLVLDKAGGPDGKPALVFSGRYGDDAFNGMMLMDWVKETPKKGYFIRLPKSPVSFHSPFLNFEGTLSEHPDGGLVLSFDSLGLPDKVLTGWVLLRRDGSDYELKADLKGGDSEFVADTGLTNGNNYGGTLRLPVLDTADEKLLKALAGFYDLMAPDTKPAKDSGAKTDIAVTIDDLRINGAKAGHLSFPVRNEGGIMTVGPLKGAVSGGDASGKLTIDGSKKTYVLTAKALVKDMKYGELQKALFGKESATGEATFDLSLASEAADEGDLVKNLKGEAAFIAAEGELSAGMLDLWGKGLIDIMMPKFGHSETMRLNCLIADLKFADGQAKTDPLFLDSDRMTIAGEGDITLSDDPQINLLLTPKPKDPVILSTAVSLRVKGPLGNPSVGPDTLSLGKKAGSLLLGVVNPAFLVFSMTDLGLNDKHPCHAFIGNKAP